MTERVLWLRPYTVKYKHALSYIFIYKDKREIVLLGNALIVK